MGRKIPDAGSSGIREGEWIRELESISRQNDAGQTVHELAVQLGKGEHYVRTLIRRAMQAGWTVLVGKKTTTRIDGAPTPVSVYTIRKSSPNCRTTGATARCRASRKRSRRNAE